MGICTLRIHNTTNHDLEGCGEAENRTIRAHKTVTRLGIANALDFIDLHLDCLDDKCLNFRVKSPEDGELLDACNGNALSSDNKTQRLPLLASLSPNPANETANVRFYAVENQPLQLTIYDLFGKIHYSMSIVPARYGGTNDFHQCPFSFNRYVPTTLAESAIGRTLKLLKQ